MSVVPLNPLFVAGCPPTEISISFSPIGVNSYTMELDESTVQMFPFGSMRMACGILNMPLPQDRNTADILQFQFHRGLAQVAGCKEQLNRCSIYDNKEAGKRLDAMLAMGESRPWPEALQALTGQREMDATAILDYFAPLKKWLDEQNQGKPVGW